MAERVKQIRVCFLCGAAIEDGLVQRARRIRTMDRPIRTWANRAPKIDSIALGFAFAVVLAVTLAPPGCSAEQGATASQGQAEIGLGRNFREFMGVQVRFSQGRPQRDLRALAELGIRSP